MTDTVTVPIFEGFVEPQQNWSKLPHQLIGALPHFGTKAEIVVVLYILRHTWGFHDDGKKITLDEFENGRWMKNKDTGEYERMDSGVGMTRPSIVKGLKDATKHGFIEVDVDTSDKGRVKKFYSLKGQGLKVFTPDVKEPYPSGENPLHRSEKETIERNSEKETKHSVAPIPSVVEQPIAASLTLDAAHTTISDAVKQAEIHLDAVEASEQSKLEFFYTALKGNEPEESVKIKIAECLKAYPYEQICEAIQFVHNAPLPKPGVMEVLDRWEFEKAMDNPGKASKPRKPNPMYDAIFSIWGHTEALNTDYAKFLQGKATKPQYKPCNVSPAVTPDELLAWAEWYKAGHKSNDGTVFMVSAPAKVQDSINRYRREKTGNTPIAPVVIGESPKAVISEMIDAESFIKREREKMRLAKEKSG